jgi:hypothetical protein
MADTTAIWEKTVDIPSFNKLKANLQTDVCIVGAGISGLTAAYLLSLSGYKVVLIEAASIAGGETGHTTAHLSAYTDFMYGTLRKYHSKRDLKKIIESNFDAINLISEIVRNEKIDCEFKRVDGFLFPHKKSAADIIQDEYKLIKKLVLPFDVFLENDPPTDVFTGPYLRFSDMGRIHILKYVNGLLTALFILIQELKILMRRNPRFY